MCKIESVLCILYILQKCYAYAITKLCMFTYEGPVQKSDTELLNTGVARGRRAGRGNIMKKKRIMPVLLSLCVGVMLTGGCGNSSGQQGSDSTGESLPSNSSESQVEGGEQSQPAEEGTADTDPFGKYDTPITVSTITMQSLTTVCPEGVDFEHNPWRDLWESMGIHVEYKAIVGDSDALSSKLNMLVTSEDLPDFFSVGDSLFQELLEADMLADLTDVYNTYASDDFKEMLYADGGKNMSNVTRDGRIYGIAQPADYMDNGAVVAIRTDWLRELNLKEPESMEDLWAIAKAFKDNKMDGTCTIGIGSTKEISAMLPMRYLINAHGGQVAMWLEKDGGLEYSLIQPEMKTALSLLHDKYEEGLLDREYGTKGEPQMFEDAVAGKSGVVVCNMTAPFFLDNGVALGQEWSYFPLYAIGGGYAPVEMSPGFSGATVVLKKCENPEAVIKLYNTFIKYGTEDPETYSSNGINNLAYPTILTRVGANHQNFLDYKYFAENGVDPETSNPGYQDTKKTNLAYLDGDMDSRILYTIFSESGSTQDVLDKELNGGGYIFDAFTGSAGEALKKYGGNLGTLANQMITDIITGAQPVEYFDEFVELWKNNGGNEITAEVNEWYRNH